MKKIILITGFFCLSLAFSSCDKNLIDEPLNDFELKSGKSGNEKLTGFDEYGYNWNAHLFKGYFYNAIVGDNLYASAPWSHSTPYNGNDNEIEFPEADALLLEYWQMAYYLRNVNLLMHWNEALISSEGDYPQSLDDWIGSDAWITFKYSGTDENGKKWSQFQKMVAANPDDKLNRAEGAWYNKDDVEIGLFNDWTQLILVEVVNTGQPPFPFNGIPSYKNTIRLGLGKTKK